MERNSSLRSRMIADLMMGYLPYQPSVYEAFSVSACMYDRRDSMVSSYLSPLIVLVSLSLPSFRGMNRRPSETVHNQMVTGTQWILYNDSMAGNIILIIDYIPPLLVGSGWDNGSIEGASKQCCVFLCTCLKWITLSNRRIATSGVALTVRANVCEINKCPELFVYVYRVLALWTGRCINIMAYN